MNIAILSYSSENYKSNKLIIDEGKKRNHNVFVLNPNNLVLYLSQKEGVNRIYTNKNGILKRLPKIHALIPRVASNVSYCASIIDFFTNNLGVYSVLSGNSVRIFSSKWLTLLKANENGIKVPKTIYCSDFNSENIDSYIESLKFPIILKLNKGSQGIGTMMFKDRNALLSTSETFSKQSNPFILQEKIKVNGRQHDFRSITVKTKCVASMRKTVQSSGSEFRSNLAKNGIGEYHQLSEKERIFISRVTDAFEGADTIGIDYMINENNEPVLLEANSNYGTKIMDFVENRNNFFDELFFHIEISVADFNAQQRKKENEIKVKEILNEEIQTLKNSLVKNENLLNELLKNEKMKRVFKSMKGKMSGYTDSEKKEKQKIIMKPQDIIEMMTDMLEIEK